MTAPTGADLPRLAQPNLALRIARYLAPWGLLERDASLSHVRLGDMHLRVGAIENASSNYGQALV